MKHETPDCFKAHPLYLPCTACCEVRAGQFRFLTGIALFWLAVLLLFPGAGRASGAYSSLYVFSDSVSTTTTTSNTPSSLFYGRRYCNGRVWVEVLAEQQGIPFSDAKNLSFFGHYSQVLLSKINNFTAPDAQTSLFVVWVCDADFVDMLAEVPIPPSGSYTTNQHLASWTTLINQSLTNHALAIQMLYEKGARALVMPNAVDISKTPYYRMSPANNSFFFDRVITFNAGLAAVLQNARASFPGLTIHSPDFFTLLEAINSNSSAYGLIKPEIDACTDLINPTLNGPGAQYVWWDWQTPTAKAQAHMASMAQQLVSPVRIQSIAPDANGFSIQAIHVPVGRTGLVEVSSSMIGWSPGPAIPGTNNTQTVTVPVSGPSQFYRLSFPFSWVWP